MDEISFVYRKLLSLMTRILTQTHTRHTQIEMNGCPERSSGKAARVERAGKRPSLLNREVTETKRAHFTRDASDIYTAHTCTGTHTAHTCTGTHTSGTHTSHKTYGITYHMATHDVQSKQSLRLFM